MFWKVVDQCTTGLPQDKPRYLMGVGYAVDLVVCSALGVDMFDCVYPSRTARFGTALVATGSLHLKSAEFAKDFRPVEEDCDCMTCLNYTRAYIHALGKEQLAGQLLTYHNIRYQMRLMQSIRSAITENRFPTFVQEFMQKQYPKGDYPNWVKEALQAAGEIPKLHIPYINNFSLPGITLTCL
jgi:queuine tRNA-ribosyltransferase